VCVAARNVNTVSSVEDGLYGLVLFINGLNGNATDNNQRMELVIHMAVICWEGGPTFWKSTSPESHVQY